MEANFTTTTNIGRAMSTVNVMDIVKHYFQFEFDIVGCGFKSVNMSGTEEDWIKIQLKTVQLIGLVSKF